MADDIVTERVSHPAGCTCLVCLMGQEIERLREELAEAYDACRYALADSPRWQELAATVVHTYEEADRG